MLKQAGLLCAVAGWKVEVREGCVVAAVVAAAGAGSALPPGRLAVIVGQRLNNSLVRRQYGHHARNPRSIQAAPPGYSSRPPSPTRGPCLRCIRSGSCRSVQYLPFLPRSLPLLH